jgi:hypothetical protein
MIISKLIFKRQCPATIKEAKQPGKNLLIFQENGLFSQLKRPQLVGERRPSYHHQLWFQEIFSKKLQNGYSQIKSTGFPH